MIKTYFYYNQRLADQLNMKYGTSLGIILLP